MGGYEKLESPGKQSNFVPNKIDNQFCFVNILSNFRGKKGLTSGQKLFNFGGK